MPLRSLFSDERFSPWADDFTLATQFVVVAAALCLRNLSSKEKYHPDGFALSYCNLILFCCYAFAISLPWWKIFSMGWRFYIGNSIRHCCCVFAISLPRKNIIPMGLRFHLAVYFNIVAIAMPLQSLFTDEKIPMGWCFTLVFYFNLTSLLRLHNLSF